MKYRAVIYLMILVVSFSCKKCEENPLDIDEYFTLLVNDTTGIKADGRSKIKIVVVKSIELKEGMKVFFQTNKGVFQNPEMEFTKDSAIALLTVDQDTGTYFIKAQIKDGADIKADKAISFGLLRAMPDFISLEPDRLAFNLTDNQKITIQTFLTRNVGLVSKGNTVNFNAYQLGTTATDTIPVGRFTGLFNNFSDANGKLISNVVFFTDTPGIDITKPVFINAFTINDEGEKVSQTLTLKYVK